MIVSVDQILCKADAINKQVRSSVENKNHKSSGESLHTDQKINKLYFSTLTNHS